MTTPSTARTKTEPLLGRRRQSITAARLAQMTWWGRRSGGDRGPGYQTLGSHGSEANLNCMTMATKYGCWKFVPFFPLSFLGFVANLNCLTMATKYGC
ncbi:hypothetical protein E2542_SST11323 [Spatholobus suberectus]|nr:hypothetical protein E2542_SST11323 [Spatholobus suberectus]